MAQGSPTRAWACRFLASAAMALAVATPGRAPAQPPQPGEVQRLTVITISMQVGGTEKETRQVTYTPPPGWYVRSHRVDCTRKYGNTSYSVSTVPRDWGWSSEVKVSESYKALIDLAGKAADAGMQARLAVEREQRLADLRTVRSTHHALVVDATAKGEGFLRSGGGLELTVTAELVFMGMDESPGPAIVRHGFSLAK